MGAFDHISPNDIGAFSDTLGIVNQINDSEAAEGRRKETYDRQKVERQDTQVALGAMQQGGDAPDNLTPSSVSAAKGVYANQRKSETMIKGLDMSDEVLSKENEIFGQMALWDGRAGEFLKQVVPETSVEMQAILGVRRKVNENSKLKYENMQQLKKTAALQYQDHQSKMTLASQYLEAGNTVLAEKALFAAVNEAPHPVYMEKNAQGNYDLYYEEVGQEKTILSQGANVTAQQAIQLIQSIPPQQAQTVFAMDMAKAQDYNSKVRPETWGKGKDKVDVFHLVDTMNPNQSQTVVFEHNGGRLDGMTVDMLRSQGYRQDASLDDQAKIAKINGAGGAKNLGKQLDQDKKALDHLLRPFKGADDGINKLTPIQAAQQFVSEFDGQKDISTDNSQRLQQAKQALSLNDSINKRIGGTYPQPAPPTPPEKPPRPGAKKAPDGNWYVKQNGKWAKVNIVEGEAPSGETPSAMDVAEGNIESGASSGDNSAMDIAPHTTSPEDQKLIDQYGDQASAMAVGTGAETVASAMGKVGDTISGIKDIDYSKVQTPNYLSGNYQTNSPASSKTAAKNQVPGKKDYGKRADGTPKGPGFLGELPGPDGTVSTEVSIGVDFDGQETEIPLLVPTLSQEEINAVLKGGQIPDSIIQKAITHAKMRISQGKSPFAEDGEQNANLAMK